MADNVYISNGEEDETGKYILFNGELVEKNITKLIIKGSRYKGGEIKSRIIFPYYFIKNRWETIPEEILKKDYPKCYDYFIKNKKILINRSLDKNYKEWYQFGRSQSIQNIHQKKIVISNIFKDKINFFEVGSDVMVYSGLFALGENLKYIKEKLESDDFIKYANIVGKNMRGGYKNINSTMVKNFFK